MGLKRWTPALIAALAISACACSPLQRSLQPPHVTERDAVPACLASRPSAQLGHGRYLLDAHTLKEVAFIGEGRYVSGEVKGDSLSDQIRLALEASEREEAAGPPTLDPDVRLTFVRKDWGKPVLVHWWSGTFWLRVTPDESGGSAFVLRVPDECLPPFAEAINQSLAGDCKVSPIAQRFRDLGMGRYDGSVLAAENGQLWRSGVATKVVWRIPSAGEPPVFTVASADGRTGSIDHVLDHLLNAAEPYREYGSLVTVPSPGCWTISVKAGAESAAITVRVF